MSKTLEILIGRYGSTMTPTQLADELKVHRGTLYQRKKRAGGADFEVPSIKIQGRRLFRTNDVASYLDNQGVTQ